MAPSLNVAWFACFSACWLNSLQAHRFPNSIEGIRRLYSPTLRTGSLGRKGVSLTLRGGLDFSLPEQSEVSLPRGEESETAFDVNNGEALASTVETAFDPQVSNNKGGSFQTSSDPQIAAEELKDFGDEALEAGHVELAAENFVRSLHLSSRVRVKDEIQEANLRDLKVHCLLKLSQCEFSRQGYREAYMYCTSVLEELDPNNINALIIRANALKEVGQYNQARDDLVRAYEIDPESDPVKMELMSLQQEMQEAAEAELGGDGGVEEDEDASSGSLMLPAEGASETGGGGGSQSTEASGVMERDIWREGSNRGAYAGLKNEGATCYLNAVMQSLFHLPGFRRAVYRIPQPPPAAGDVPSVVVALQRLFWRLEESKGSVSTAELLASFGWDSGDAIEQQDISDFCHMLLDRLDEAMKPLPPDQHLARLCGVKMEYTDTAAAVGWSKRREDTSMVTVLHGVKECADVPASLELLCRAESIDEYDTEQFGKQTVQRRGLFQEVPPILLLNLNRLDFCPYRGIPVKINSRFAFYTSLDLTPFLSPPTPDTPPRNAHYTLCGVIVHMGTAEMGHYVAYVRTCRKQSESDGEEAGGEGSEEWYRFDDETVTRVSAREAMEDNYGSDDDTPPPRPRRGQGVIMTRSAMRRLRSAYMLVYVRDDVWGDVFNTSGMSLDVPQHVRNYSHHTASLPRTLHLLLPEHDPPLSDPSRPQRRLRGRWVNVTVPSDGTVGDVIKAVAGETAMADSSQGGGAGNSEHWSLLGGPPVTQATADDTGDLDGVGGAGESAGIEEGLSESKLGGDGGEGKSEAAVLAASPQSITPPHQAPGGVGGALIAGVGAPELGLCIYSLRAHTVPYLHISFDHISDD